jgi:hypothetical protein
VESASRTAVPSAALGVSGRPSAGPFTRPLVNSSMKITTPRPSRSRRIAATVLEGPGGSSWPSNRRRVRSAIQRWKRLRGGW